MNGSDSGEWGVRLEVPQSGPGAPTVLWPSGASALSQPGRMRSLLVLLIQNQIGGRMSTRLLIVVVLAVLAACSGGNSLTAPPGGGGTGDGGTPLPAGNITLGNNFFRSAHNGSVNAAVDTVAAGSTVTWTWSNTGSVPHSIRSLGSPIFRNSVVQSGAGSMYQVVFNRAGTYQYDCAVHGGVMSGTIVVQ
jgi:hypothetical protein